ncbi:hypothetical protein MOE47_09530 [Bacillus atrophaeus]|uniref:hypothetical protein n=1 Tax=Bacillus atrophaeus TaxID=1452 RepID=UPI00227D9C39|nr:hypothetical protein [Bacillus atrophaeus]MCY8913204.1 hypothetical protein [Bacillus atrophaeus]MCY9114648.1 hypothetical protein [Bacillus atrophaeus]MEC0924144.1 hypothetical protein [Bacillus atrophaeus]MEC0932755.1 hypothetical protein [Bacillus atrophaeus]
MKQVYEYDENFFFTVPLTIEPDEEGNYSVPENCTTVQFIRARFHPEEQRWTEEATQEEKDALLKQIENGKVPSPLEELKSQNASIMVHLAEAQNLIESQAKMIADLLLMLAEGGEA